MEFNEKLQELRKSRSLTQEALAEALYVSRTAISKWESGRGYPSIDSLKAISRYFSITIDELICPEEIISAAEDEKRAFVGRSLSLICGALDILPAALWFMPVVGGGAEGPASAPLFGLTGVQPWIKAVFAALILLTVLNGLCGVIVSRLDRPAWDRHRRVTGLALSVIGCAVFIVTRQPYTGILYFSILVVKGILIIGMRKSALRFWH
ncbi:MAG: helix-turn-helix transcriptional regulator [Clostridia bacterium]|nr:helix-turn-helix transcriptional regulator [Clostridia bacterium]